MNPVSAIANAAGSLFQSIGGIVTNAQIIKQIRELQDLQEYEKLPDWIRPADVVTTQKANEETNQDTIMTWGLMLLILLLVIGIVLVALK